MSRLGEMERLPCGCLVGTDLIDGQPTFLMIPCADDCEYYIYALAESRRQGKRVTKIDAR